jgi:hypothetical protein
MEPESDAGIGRRQSLVTMAALVTGGIAGCSSLDSQDGVGNSGAVDVIAYSAASEPRTVSITVTGAEAETPHTSRTETLEPGEAVDPVNPSKLPTNTSSYTVEVAVTDGPSEQFEWTDPTVDLAPLWVIVDDSRNINFLLQAG